MPARTRSWGFTPRWYSVAPTALIPLALLAICLLNFTGCNSRPVPATTIATPAHATYPPRPSTPPAPFKLFHTTDTSLTLVTDDHATDDQLAAILYQLHDAAHTHTFAALRLPQAFIDKRDPIVFIHIYRGAKCASEKYTTGKLPCDASYHAAADYTLGSFANKNRDAGVLLHDNQPQTALWNPDAP